MRIIERPLYLDRLLSVVGTPDIKVVTGIRRSGKSKLLEALADRIRQEDPQANLIRVNFNLLEFENLTEYHALHRWVEEHYVPGVRNLVMIDEVQMCEGFEKAINSLHASERYDIYVTGSNAFLMSSDLATLFTGRTFEVEVLPFSLEEFARFHDLTDPAQALDRYLREGGMPGSYVYPSEQARYTYLADVMDMLVLRDIRVKHGIRQPEQLARMRDFLMGNVGNLISTRNVASGLTAAGLPVSDRTVAAYLDHLCAAYAFYRVRRFDIAGKRYLRGGEKYYLADHAFRYAALGTKSLDWGRMYENMVALELMRRGWEVYVGTLQRKEVDFVAVRRGERMYVQVSDDVSAPRTVEREIAPLRQIRDNYPKLILARTGHEAKDWDGIKLVDLATWLMGGREG